MINWIQGDVLITHTGRYDFEGQEKGNLFFGSYYLGYSRFSWPLKQVTDMVKSGEWKQQKFIQL